MARIGVFVCWCGSNIASTVDVKAVAEAARSFPGVAHSVEYKYMCSDPGQGLIRQAIAEKKLPDLNSNSIEAAERVVAGTARSMGIEITD